MDFEAHLVGSSFRNIQDNHCLIVVNNVLKNGDSYAVDVGSGYLMRAVSLEFDKKSEIYRDAFTTYFLEWNESKNQIVKYIEDRNG